MPYTLKQLFELFQLLEINDIVLSNHLAVFIFCSSGGTIGCKEFISSKDHFLCKKVPEVNPPLILKHLIRACCIQHKILNAEIIIFIPLTFLTLTKLLKQNEYDFR